MKEQPDYNVRLRFGTLEEYAYAIVCVLTNNAKTELESDLQIEKKTEVMGQIRDPLDVTAKEKWPVSLLDIMLCNQQGIPCLRFATQGMTMKGKALREE